MEEMHCVYIDENNKIYLNLVPEMIEERIKRNKKLDKLSENSLFLGKPNTKSDYKDNELLEKGMYISEPIPLSEWVFDALFDWFDAEDDLDL